jgi:hypothetical protein
MWFPRAAVVLVCCAVFVGSAAAAPLSHYEQESLREGLERTESTLEPAPEGKIIEGIDVVTLDVIEPRDPAPRFLNWFHATSREEVVRRESLLHPGDRYTRNLAEETERNLRVRQLSVVLVAATRGGDPGKVRVLIVTKDVWSLRINFEPTFVNGRLQSVLLQPSEENLFGRHKILNATITMGRATYSLGLGFNDPRVGGSRLQAQAAAAVVFNCITGRAEGSNGVFSYGKPLYSTRTKWAWVTAASWVDGEVRPRGTRGNSVCSDDRPTLIDFAATPERESIPYQYHQERLASEFGVTRSFGTFMKNDVKFGLESARQNYRLPDLSDQTPLVRELFRSRVPVNDQRLSPFVELHSYRNRFHRVIDLESLGLQEDYRLGYDVWLRAYPALEALGSTRNMLGVYSGLGYTVPLSDGLARAYASSTIELSRPDATDAEVTAGTRFVTPRLPFGRIVLDGFVQDRYENYLNPQLALGGTTRLRGYRALAFTGPNVVVGNVEIRSRPIEILSVQVGVAAFYDVGDAFARWDELSLKHGVGGGLRFVFPQIERTVLRVEMGIPLNRNDPGAETALIVQLRQAFVMPGLVSPGLVQ